ncbi:hypothetical protein DSO57_1027120 [Entomophthora muscae]|uniref:Uncharacterized protein n=1 Tax=Entomophthora muscae TaxID=34485 RepID=A0ACC2UC02_9FUNG|nr:hypothetical protein DSO57_1027120 [Entomophthora muscae]
MVCKWHEDHPEKDWGTYKRDFLARFVMKDTALMIIRQVMNLTQAGTVKELTRAYKEPCLWAPSDMAFENPATHLMHYDTLKQHAMRHINLDQVSNLQSLYCEAEKAEQTSNASHKAQAGKGERPKDFHLSGHANCPPPGNSSNNNDVVFGSWGRHPGGHGGKSL